MGQGQLSSALSFKKMFKRLITWLNSLTAEPEPPTCEKHPGILIVSYPANMSSYDACVWFSYCPVCQEIKRRASELERQQVEAEQAALTEKYLRSSA